MFAESIPYYDAIYRDKDYGSESEHVRGLIEGHLRSGGNRLLDVACGTGRHLEHLKQHFDVEGLDLSAELLEVARARNPDVPVHQGSMEDFDLGSSFDVVTCLFSSIGYVQTIDGVRRTARSFYRHLAAGGLLILEPWFEPDAWETETVHAIFVDEPQLKIARVDTSRREGDRSVTEYHYVVGTPDGTEHFVERHEMGLFTHREVGEVLEGEGFEVSFDAEGLLGRGLFTALRS